MTQVILVIGACALDRIVSVAAFPEEDSKIRSTAYHEFGGGNAANTAYAMALLSNATCLNEQGFVIKLISKVGRDKIGTQITSDLQHAGVDLTSPLFRYGCPGSTTSFTTVVVSDSQFTRTCIHTPGTCGPLTLEDADGIDMDIVLKDVVHVHSDCRFIEISLLVAREAQRRGLSISVDPEKDRFHDGQDSLLELATTVFFNAKQMKDYFRRRTTILETQHGRDALGEPKVECCLADETLEHEVIQSIQPSLFFQRWYGESQLKKEFVITKGSMGAIHVLPTLFHKKEIVEGGNKIIVHDDLIGEMLIKCSMSERSVHSTCHYHVHTCGVLKSIAVVDTTGAGDAFVAGYLLLSLCDKKQAEPMPSLAIEFGSWVAGSKVQGPGARVALPRGILVDDVLGRSIPEIARSVKALLGSFGASVSSSQDDTQKKSIGLTPAVTELTSETSEQRLLRETLSRPFSGTSTFTSVSDERSN